MRFTGWKGGIAIFWRVIRAWSRACWNFTEDFQWSIMVFWLDTSLKTCSYFSVCPSSSKGINCCLGQCFVILGFTVNCGVDACISSKCFCSQWAKLQNWKGMLVSVGLGEKCDPDWYTGTWSHKWGLEIQNFPLQLRLGLQPVKCQCFLLSPLASPVGPWCCLGSQFKILLLCYFMLHCKLKFRVKYTCINWGDSDPSLMSTDWHWIVTHFIYIYIFYILYDTLLCNDRTFLTCPEGQVLRA